jgi:hypothetical protein
VAPVDFRAGPAACRDTLATGDVLGCALLPGGIGGGIGAVPCWLGSGILPALGLALGCIAGKPVWAAPLQGWHRQGPPPGTKIAATRNIGMTTGSKEAQLGIPPPAPGSTKQ